MDTEPNTTGPSPHIFFDYDIFPWLADSYIHEPPHSYFALKQFPRQRCSQTTNRLACASSSSAETCQGCWRESSVKWRLLTRSSLEQKHTNSQQWQGSGWAETGWWRIEWGFAAGLWGGLKWRETERSISSVTSVGWLVTCVRCGSALGGGQSHRPWDGMMRRRGKASSVTQACRVCLSQLVLSRNQNFNTTSIPL